MTEGFGLGQEATQDGRFERQESRFRGWITPDGSSGFPAAAGRYHLYVSLACPWCHRTVIVRRLKGLEDVVKVSYVDPFRDERGWAFSGGRFTDQVNGWALLSDAYAASDPGFTGRITVPVLWDTRDHVIVSNESADIVRMFNDGFGALADEFRARGLRRRVKVAGRPAVELTRRQSEVLELLRRGLTTAASESAALDW